MRFNDWTVRGREAEVKTVLELFASGARLVSLVGPGGVGKTAVARRVLESADVQQGAATFWFDAELHADKELVAQVDMIANLFKDSPAVAGVPLLLVLDGAPSPSDRREQRLGELARELLDSNEDLRIVTTSRRVLRLPFARPVEIRPFTVPADPADLNSALALVQGEAALAIFADRATAVAPRFMMDLPTVISLLAICRKLGGLPLAIHLASLRSSALPPEAILDELDDPFPLLADDYSLVAPARHHSMQACIESNLEALLPEEESILTAIASFPGGCTLDTLRDVRIPRSDSVDEQPILRIVSALAEWHLVRPSPARPSGTRFTTDPLIQAFVSAHRQSPITLMRQITPKLSEQFDAHVAVKGSGWDDASAWVEDEYLNLLKLIQDALLINDTHSSARVVHGLCRYWRHRGLLREGLITAEHVLAAGDLAVEDEARVIGVVGGLRAHVSSYTSAYTELARSVELWRRVDDPGNLAAALVTFSAAAQEVDGIDSARAALEEAMSLFEKVGDRWSYARTLGLLGAVMANDPKELDFARKCLEETSALLLALGDRGAASLPMEHLGRMLIESGDLDQAFPVLEYGLSESRSLRDSLHTSAYLNLLAWGESLMDRPGRAASRYLESLEIAVHLGLKARAVWCLEGLEEVLGALRSSELAALAGASAQVLRDDLGLEYWVEFCCPRRPAKPAPGAASRASQIVQTGGEVWPPEAVLTRVPAFLSDLADTGARAVAANKLERPAGLTPREIEILGLLANGLTSRDIANNLVISIDTVGRHITNIYRKIGARGRSDATSYAFRMNLVPDVA